MENTRTTAFSLRRRIGSTYFTLNARFAEAASETMEDKILRIIKNEAGANDMACGIIVTPQMSRPA